MSALRVFPTPTEVLREQLGQWEPLPSAPGEYSDAARSSWLPGIYIDGVECASSVISVLRLANNEVAYEDPVLDYQIVAHLWRDTNRSRVGLDAVMDPEAAITLGRALLAAGAAALRDLALNASFLTEGTDR